MITRNNLARIIFGITIQLGLLFSDQSISGTQYKIFLLTSKMAGAAPPRSVVQDLSQHLVPAEETECGEYVYRLPLKLEEHVTQQKKGEKGQKRTQGDNLKKQVKYKYNAGEDLGKVISALLNTSGGVIQLHPCEPEVYFREKEFEEWRNNLEDKLKFTPKDVLNDCVSLKWNMADGLLYISVYKSHEFVTANAFLYTRNMAKNKEVTHFKFVTHVINQQTTTRDCKLPLAEPFNYGDTCTNMETESLEFKHYDTATNEVEHLIKKVNNDRFMKALLGMANLSGGGDVVLGVKEDPITKQNRLVGQRLSKSQEAEFRQKFQQLLEQDTNGRRRIWGDERTVPREGTHWSCQFIPLQTSGSSSNPLTRHVLIHIHMFHCPGGAFLQKPEAFILEDNGNIEEMPFDEWQNRHRTTAAYLPAASGPLVRMTSPAVTPAKSTPLSKPSSKSSKAPGPSALSSTVVPTRELKENISISYTKNSSTWQGTFEVSQRTNLPQHPEVRDLFLTEFPLRYNPSRRALQQILINHSLPHMLQSIDTKVGNPGFGIAANSLFNCMKHSCTALPRVPNHIMDLLIVTEDAAMSIKTINKGNISPEDGRKYNAYTVIMARILKRRVLEGMIKVQNFPKFFVSVSLFDSTGAAKPTPQIYWSKQSLQLDTGCFQRLCEALSHVLKDMNTCFRNLIVREEDLCLSAEQTRILLDLDSNRFNVIEGPPGCGKTLLAHMYCKSKGKEACYISSSWALVIRAKAKGFDAYFAVDSSEVLELLDESLRQYRHIIIDDNHNYVYTETQLHRLCKHIAAVNIHLHVFQDSVHHNYLANTDPSKFGLFVYAHRCMYGMPHLKTLNEIHRNTRVVGSFLEEQVADLLPESTKPTVRNMSSIKGDDVVIQQIANLRMDSLENGLLKHVTSLLASSVDPHGQQYTSRDVAILVDHKIQKEARKEREFFTRLFRKRSDLIVHNARVYPVEGIIIDRVDNYIGLESRVVIFIMPIENRFDQENANIKYRIAIASRGIDRADFLQEQILLGTTAKGMKMDIIPWDALKDLVPVWSRVEKQPVLDVCWEREGEDATLLYTTEMSIRRVSVTGKLLPLTINTTRLSFPSSVTCRSDGELAVVTDTFYPGSWVTYHSRVPGVYRRHITKPVDGILNSARVTPQGCLAVLCYKPLPPPQALPPPPQPLPPPRKKKLLDAQGYLQLYRGVSDNGLLWDQPVSPRISESDFAWPTLPGALSVSETGNILVCQLESVTEHSATDGSHVRTIPYPAGMKDPSVVCAAPSGRVWVGCWDGSVWLCDVTGGDKIFETVGGRLNSLALHGHRLAVATQSGGLQLYDVHE